VTSYCSSQLMIGCLTAMASLPVAVPLLGFEALRLESGGAVRLVARVNEADSKREAGIRKIVAVRRYVLHNKHWEKDAVMRVRMTYEAGSGKKFRSWNRKTREAFRNVPSKRFLRARLRHRRQISMNRTPRSLRPTMTSI